MNTYRNSRGQFCRRPSRDHSPDCFRFVMNRGPHPLASVPALSPDGAPDDPEAVRIPEITTMNVSPFEAV